MLNEVREEFHALISRPVEQIDLARAALLFATQEYPELDVEHYLAVIDQIALSVLEKAACLPVRARLKALNRTMFGEMGFKGNTEEYYDPRNSFLNDVLDRRCGIPITLSLVYLEAGRRAALPLYGVGLPGHFIVKLQDEEGQDIFLDPFHGGQEMNREQCRRLASKFLRDGQAFDDAYLDAILPGEMLTRMLRNLKAIYSQQSRFDKLLWVCDFLILTRPEHAEDLRDRGLVNFNLRRFGSASKDLQRYLEMQPNPSDLERIRTLLKQSWRLQAMMN